MSATEHAFTEALPARLYMDSDLLVAVLVDGEPHHARSRILFERLAREVGCTLYLSSLSWLEFASVVTREQFRRGLPTTVQQRFRLDRWQHPVIREGYLQFFLQALETLLDQITWEEVVLTPQIRKVAIQYVSSYALRPYDAVHLATATMIGVYDFASFDNAFRRVDGVHLWNDKIHGV